MSSSEEKATMSAQRATTTTTNEHSHQSMIAIVDCQNVLDVEGTDHDDVTESEGQRERRDGGGTREGSECPTDGNRIGFVNQSSAFLGRKSSTTTIGVMSSANDFRPRDR